MSTGSTSAIAQPVPDASVAKTKSASSSDGETTAPATGVRRRAAAGAVDKPNSTRAAGHGGSSQTMLKLYTPDGEGGLKVDPFVVVILSLAFIASIFFLHISSKIIRNITKP